MSTYLDHNATTPMRPAAIDAMCAVLRECGNASSVHAAGRAARAHLDGARRSVAALVGADPGNVVFTGGGTEANNLALRGAGRTRVLVSAVEHDSVLRARPDAEVIPVDCDGLVRLDVLERMLAATAVPTLVSVMLANNETGTIQPVADVASLARKHGAVVHCDAVQAAGKTPVDCVGLGVDYLTLSAHKLGGPQGVGALVLCGAAALTQAQAGGGQERGRRAGTENVAGIAGFGVAAAIATTETCWIDGIRTLRDGVERRIAEESPGSRVFGAGTSRVATTSCVTMPGVTSQTQLMAFDLRGVHVSTGAACSSGKVRPSHVLKAMGVDDGTAGEAIRVSFGWSSVKADAEALVGVWIDQFRRLSPRASRLSAAA